VNDAQVYVKYSWDSLEDALSMFVPHAFMARLDISACYRHFMVHPSHWCVQGVELGGQHYVYTRLQFGLRLAPELAHRFTMFIKRVLHANGVVGVVGVMDDYLLMHCDFRACLVMLAVAVALLQDLGFSVDMKPGKTMPPARVQKFVGVVINTARCTLSLPVEKLSSPLQDVSAVLQRRLCAAARYTAFSARCSGLVVWCLAVVSSCGHAVMRYRMCCTLVIMCPCRPTCVMTFRGGCQVLLPTMVWCRWRRRV
jgi:hypothetical protein